ncbi:hypothetical protein Slin14017_G077110 [Septoria linicola]|nr:hypothetical protein Slin14017_G077110 [Septoria linicola]
MSETRDRTIFGYPPPVRRSDNHTSPPNSGIQFSQPVLHQMKAGKCIRRVIPYDVELQHPRRLTIKNPVVAIGNLESKAQSMGVVDQLQRQRSSSQSRCLPGQSQDVVPGHNAEWRAPPADLITIIVSSSEVEYQNARQGLEAISHYFRRLLNPPEAINAVPDMQARIELCETSNDGMEVARNNAPTGVPEPSIHKGDPRVDTPTQPITKIFLNQVPLPAFYDFGKWLATGRILQHPHTSAPHHVETYAFRLLDALELAVVLEMDSYQNAVLCELFLLGPYLDDPEEYADKIFSLVDRIVLVATGESFVNPLRWLIVAIMAAKTEGRGRRRVRWAKIQHTDVAGLFGAWIGWHCREGDLGCEYPTSVLDLRDPRSARGVPSINMGVSLADT